MTAGRFFVNERGGFSLSLGTAGCVQDACRIMRDALRSQAAIGAKRVYAKVLGRRAEPRLEPFACGRLCMECRYLAEPPRRGDPMRSEVDAESLGPCPHCGERAWSDLRNIEMRTRVDDVDAFDEAEDRRRHRRSIVRLMGLSAFASGVGGLAMIGSQTSWLEALFVLVLCTVAFGPLVGIVAISTATGFSVRQKRRTNPARWRMVAPRPPRRRGASQRGVVETEAPLRAPLTGRSCAAYEIGIREDRRRWGPAASWALLEQHTADLRVGDVDLASDQAYVQVRGRDREAVVPTLEEEALRTFLRERGLDPARDYVTFETIVPVGATCRIWPSRRGSPATLAPT